MPSCLSVVASCFFKNFFSLFVTFLLLVTFINYFLLLRKARGIILLYLLHSLKGAGAPWFFSYTYDLATTPVRTQAGGCLTTKKAP
jgi:hypothetical protein